MVEVLAGFVKGAILMGAYAQLIGMPLAWLRLRRTPAWVERPTTVRRIDLLADFIIWATLLAIAWGWLCFIAAAAGLSTGALLVLLFGAPLIFVPWLVLQLDVGRFPEVVEKARRRREEKLAG